MLLGSAIALTLSLNIYQSSSSSSSDVASLTSMNNAAYCQNDCLLQNFQHSALDTARWSHIMFFGVHDVQLYTSWYSLGMIRLLAIYFSLLLSVEFSFQYAVNSVQYQDNQTFHLNLSHVNSVDQLFTHHTI